MRCFAPLLAAVFIAPLALAQAPTTAPAGGGVGRFPHLEVDVKARELRIECEALEIDAPLEFFCVLNGTSEHESVLRSAVRPSHVHAGLLMLGLKPGSPTRYVEQEKKWLPPTGDPLQIDVEFERDGKAVRVPASQLMRDIKTHQAMPAARWVFAGSRVMEDGKYAADVTGYLVSVVNFDLSLIDVPELRSSSNETLEWERNPQVAPKKGAKVTMIIAPAKGPASRPVTRPVATRPAGGEP
jgi:hypothetical protein